MKEISISIVLFFALTNFLVPVAGISAERLEIEHPIKSPQKYTDKEKCDNCGMDRNKWARTRHEFQDSKGTFHTCSINCVAALSIKTKTHPMGVKVAEYLKPENMLDAEKAFYVVGSTAPGTMSPISKAAFSAKEEAEKFSVKYGGTVMNFEGALNAARTGFEKQNRREHKH